MDLTRRKLIQSATALAGSVSPVSLPFKGLSDIPVLNKSGDIPFWQLRSFLDYVPNVLTEFKKAELFALRGDFNASAEHFSQYSQYLFFFNLNEDLAKLSWTDVLDDDRAIQQIVDQYKPKPLSADQVRQRIVWMLKQPEWTGKIIGDAYPQLREQFRLAFDIHADPLSQVDWHKLAVNSGDDIETLYQPLRILGSDLSRDLHDNLARSYSLINHASHVSDVKDFVWDNIKKILRDDDDSEFKPYIFTVPYVDYTFQRTSYHVEVLPELRADQVRLLDAFKEIFFARFGENTLEFLDPVMKDEGALKLHFVPIDSLQPVLNELVAQSYSQHNPAALEL